MIAIVGKGNVGSHLFEALKDKTETCLVDSRHPEEIPEGSEIILLCVTDDALPEVAALIHSDGGLVAHTSGSVDIKVLQNTGKEFGVMYPLQTFTKGFKTNYSEIPMFVEGNSKESLKKLKELASLISKNVKEADSQTRKKLHLASVFACNFTNALAYASETILKDTGFDLSVLLPLMRQTVKKLDTLTPARAQTGPAKRGDNNIINRHLEMLESQPYLQDIYRKLTDLIIKTNET